ncbi:hypothetical protein ACFWAR_01115 [Streptomyces sp. NPDC059917]|uniref:hypothetical protein n=1 Tax=Streptomyces sp. NPDC059917 TaxID=3347002 RepID=UPI0036513DD1
MPIIARNRSRGAAPPAAPREADNPGTAPGRRPVGKVVLVLMATAVAVVGTAALIQAAPEIQAFLDFGAGVLALLALSGAVMWGLTATDRKVLYPEHRLWTQRVHRILAVAGLGFLLLHIWIKVERNSVLPLAAVVPFTDTTQPVLIGLGSLAGYVFVGVAITGAARSRFTSTRGSLLWRALHMSAYLAWGAALLHGLKAGREAAVGITVAYVAAVAAVAVALLLKMREKNTLDSQSQSRSRPVPRAAAPAPTVGRPPSEPLIPVPVVQPGAPRLTFERPTR